MNGLDTLNDISFEDIQFKIHKLNGELKIHIRHDDEGDRHGLFVHGFRLGSLAEGILQVGDELLEVNGVDVKSKYLEDVIQAFSITLNEDYVYFNIRRRFVENKLIYKKYQIKSSFSSLFYQNNDFDLQSSTNDYISSRPSTTLFKRLYLSSFSSFFSHYFLKEFITKVYSIYNDIIAYPPISDSIGRF